MMFSPFLSGFNVSIYLRVHTSGVYGGYSYSWKGLQTNKNIWDAPHCSRQWGEVNPSYVSSLVDQLGGHPTK